MRRFDTRALTRNAALGFNAGNSTSRAHLMKFLHNQTRIDAACGFEKRVNAQFR
jgi:hypothetical protein